VTRAISAQLRVVPAVLADEGLAATEQLYRDHGDFVWRAAARMGVGPEDREDVVQDVFIVAHRRLGTFEGRSAITSWLYGITRGIVLNRQRLRQRRGQHLRNIAASTAGASDPSSGIEAADVLARFAKELDPAHLEVFELTEIEGMSGPEIAAALGVNVNTVYTRLRAARKAFLEFARRELPRTQEDHHG